MKGRKKSTVKEVERALARSVSMSEDADREWLTSLFRSFERNWDLDALVAWRTRHGMGQGGFDPSRSAGRRLRDRLPRLLQRG